MHVSTQTATRQRIVGIIASFLIVATLTSGCGTADYDERMSYLRTVALRGIETHNLLRNQGSSVDKSSCRLAREGLIDDIPNDIGGAEARVSKEWVQLVDQTFMRACTSGRY
jgi:hypothetical protein